MAINKKRKKKIRALNREGKPLSEIAKMLDLQEDDVRDVLAEVKTSRSDRISVKKGTVKSMIDFSWILGAIVAVAPLVPLMISQESFDPGNMIQRLWILPAILLLLGLSLVNGKTVSGVSQRSLYLMIPFVLFLGWVGVSRTWSINGFEHGWIFLNWIAAGCTLYLAISFFSTKKGFLNYALVVSISAFVIYLIGLLQYWEWRSFMQQSTPPAATFGNKNMAAQFTALTLPLLATVLFTTRKRGIAIFSLLAAATGGAFLFHTFTKGSWVAFVVGVMVWGGLVALLRKRLTFMPALEKGRRRWFVAAAIGFTVMLCCITPDGIRFRPAEAFGYVAAATADSLGDQETANEATIPEAKGTLTGGKGSVGARLGYWRNSVPMFLDFPVVGVGAGHWKIHYPLYSNRVVEDQLFSINSQAKHPHNDYIEVLCELGVVGFVLLFGSGLCMIAIMVRALRRSAGDELWIAIGATAGLVILVVNACFSFPLSRAMPLVLGACFLGALWYLAQGSDPSKVQWPKKLLQAIGLCFVLVGVYAGAKSFAFGKANIDYGRMTTWDRRGDANKCLTYARAVMNYNSWNQRPLFFVARSQMRLKRTEDAIETTRRFQRFFPNHIGAKVNLAAMYKDLGRNDEALEVANRLIADFSHVPMGYMIKGSILFEQKRLEEAYEFSKIGVDLMDTATWQAGFNHALIAAKFGKHKEAMASYDSAISCKPTGWRTYFAAGRHAEEALKDPARAVRYYSRGRDFAPANVKGQFNARLKALGVDTPTIKK